MYFNSLQEEQNNGLSANPPLTQSSGNGQLVTASRGAGTNPRSSSVQGTGQGSGKWTNISDYLNANPSIGKTAIEQGTSALGNETGGYDAAAQPFRDENVRPIINDEIFTDTSLRAGNLDPLRQGLTQKVDLPDTVQWSLDKNGDLTKSQKLANKDTVVDELAKDPIKQGKYGLGNRTLDTSLLSADQNYIKGQPTLFGNIGSYISKVNEEVPKLNTKVQKKKALVKSAVDQNTETLGRIKDRAVNDINTKLTSLLQQSTQAKKDILKRYTDWYNNPGGSQKYFIPQVGVDPTLNNIGDTEDYRRFSGLNSILGTSLPTQNGTYKLPSAYEVNAKNPNPQTGKGKRSTPDWVPLPEDFYSGPSIPLPSDPNTETPEQLARRLGL